MYEYVMDPFDEATAREMVQQCGGGLFSTDSDGSCVIYSLMTRDQYNDPVRRDQIRTRYRELYHTIAPTGTWL